MAVGPIRVAHLNIRGTTHKTLEITTMMKENNYDITFFTETWLGEENRVPWPLVKGSPAIRIAQNGRLSGGICYTVGRGRDVQNVKVLYERDGMILVVEAWGICICCLYIPPLHEAERDILKDALIHCATSRKPTILIGDFNARSQELTGDHASNARGQWIFHSLSDCGFRHIPSQWGVPTFVGRQGNSIVDLVFASNTIETAEECANVDEENWCASDHRPIHVEILPPRSPQLIQAREAIRLEKLKDPEIEKQYQDAIAAKVPNLVEYIRNIRNLNTQAQKIVDLVDLAIRECLISTGRHILGTKRIGTGVATEDKQLESLRKARNARYRDLEQAPPELRQMYFDLYIQARNRWREAMEIFRRREFQALSENLEKMEAPEVSKSIRHLAHKYLKIGGTRLDNSDESLEECRTHFTQQFRRRSKTPGPQYPHRSLPWRGHRILRPRLLQAMKCCANGKAPGRTGLRAELFKTAALSIVEPIQMLFEICMEFGMVPKAWTEANIIPIPKKPGTNKVNEHRPISLTEHLRKLFEKTILLEVIQAVEPLGREQGGFRARRSTIDQAAALHETILQHRLKYNRNPCVAYLDVTAAYDSVPRDILWNILRSKDMPMELLRILQALFDNCTSRVIIGGKESNSLPHECGLLQGSSLSPVLYSAYINGVAQEARKTATVTLNGEPIGALLYADDIALVANNERSLQLALDNLAEHSHFMGFQFNPKKCEVVAPGPITVTLYGAPLTQVPKFKYLGVEMNHNGIDAEALVKRNIQKAKSTVGAFIRLGFRAGGLLERTKVLLYKLFIRPQLEYGLSILPHISNYLPELEQVQYFALRMMLSMPHGYSYNTLRVLATCPSIKERVEELRAGWGMRLERCSAETFMIGLAHRSFASRPSSKSVFWTLDKNPILLEVRKIRLTTTSKVKPKSNEYTLVRKSFRMDNLLKARSLSPNPSALRIDGEMKPLQLYSFSALQHVKKQLLLRWIGGKAICLPTYCPVCGHKGAQAHWAQCHGLGELSILIEEGCYERVLDSIQRVVELYHSLKTPDSRDP